MSTVYQGERKKHDTYKIVVGDLQTLQDHVNEALRHGWELYGFIGFDGTKNQFFQALTRQPGDYL